MGTTYTISEETQRRVERAGQQIVFVPEPPRWQTGDIVGPGHYFDVNPNTLYVKTFRVNPRGTLSYTHAYGSANEYPRPQLLPGGQWLVPEPTPLIDPDTLQMCSRGYHVSPFAHAHIWVDQWFATVSYICEITAPYLVHPSPGSVSVNHKRCAAQVRLIMPLPKVYNRGLVEGWYGRPVNSGEFTYPARTRLLEDNWRSALERMGNWCAKNYAGITERAPLSSL